MTIPVDSSVLIQAQRLPGSWEPFSSPVKLPILSIQYHSEASPGPMDNVYLFDRFLEMVRDYKQQMPRRTIWLTRYPKFWL